MILRTYKMICQFSNCPSKRNKFVSYGIALISRLIGIISSVFYVEI
jgi:hypothetical protein